MHRSALLLIVLMTAAPLRAEHWAFTPIRDVQPPAGPAAHPIDRFLPPTSALADKRTLLRRVTFDLIGLPPTPQEIDAFLNDDSPGAFATVVERLLASPHYGEKWGRHWMDVVRYADTAGDNADYPVPEARLYRDWIIDAFNADMPYDQFVREQLAGDILAKSGPPEKYAGRVIATTYLALSRRYLTAPYESWHLTLEDTIDTTGRAFLGLTLRCARCHDHKYDPITREDYYGLYGIFASTEFPYAGSEEFVSQKFPRRHFAAIVPPECAAAIRRAAAEREARLRVQAARAMLFGPLSDLPPIASELKTRTRLGTPPELPVAYAVSEGTPVDAAIQVMGEPDKLGPVVKRGAPKSLGRPFTVREGSGRLELANWIADPANPLTARVMVNRIWQYHFGRGVVPTPSNFGARGEPPTHPELLDWLARRFIDSGWSIKALHRLIVSSAAYQQAGRRQRLDAEAIRDAMLAVSGNLDRSRPGVHPFPPIAAWGWTQHSQFKDVYPSHHRSVYLMTQRLQRHPYLCLFDGPDANTTTDVRGSSTVPSQALWLMNNAFVREQSRGLAARLLTLRDDRARVTLAYELCFARLPSSEEIDITLAYLARFRRELSEAEAWASVAKVLISANEFVYID
jgi:hypothetical protein